MEDVSPKALIFAVSLFVTMVVVSLVVVTFGKIKEIYAMTKNTDNSIHASFENIYQTYDGKELNGMGVLNTVKKFEEENDVVSEVRYPAYASIRNRANSSGKREVVVLKEYFEGRKTIGGHTFKYETMYTAKVKEIDGKTIIEFNQ